MSTVKYCPRCKKRKKLNILKESGFEGYNQIWTCQVCQYVIEGVGNTQ